MGRAIKVIFLNIVMNILMIMIFNSRGCEQLIMANSTKCFVNLSNGRDLLFILIGVVIQMKKSFVFHTYL